MSNAPNQFPVYTVDDYSQWEGSWELWEGVPIAMAPSPFGRHQTVVSQIVTRFTNAIELIDCAAVAVAELDWIVQNDTVVRPDVMVICGEAPEKHQRDPPAIVVEVLSPSTQANDRGFKAALYRKLGVGVYLIVDPIQETVESISMTKSSDAPVPLSGEMTKSICEDCSLTVDTNRFFPKQS